MDEKVLIKSEQYKIKKPIICLIVLSVVSIVIGYICAFFDSYSWFNERGYKVYAIGDTYDSAWDYAWNWTHISDRQVIIGIIIAAILLVIGAIVFLIAAGTQLTVTDKRVYGSVAFIKRVDLPVDSVSAVGTGLFNGIAVATSSGKISFFAIKNRNEIHKVLSALMIERQNMKASVHKESPVTVQTTDSADQLKKFKALLDSGVITQEEFDAKKKQLLGL